jgi:hypothetical protein
MAGAYVAGWTVNTSARKPRFSVEFDHASGDPANKDGHRQTFDQMYANNHNYYGIADLMGWRNMRDARVGFECLITKQLKLQADFNEFYLATTQDGFYNAGGTRTVLNRSATSRHIGSEIDVLGVFQFTKALSVGAGIAHLFAGDYLKQSTKGGGYNYPFLTWTKRLSIPR